MAKKSSELAPQAPTIPDIEPMKEGSSALLRRANALVVNSPESLQLAVDLIKAAKAPQAVIKAALDPQVKNADALHKFLVRLKKVALAVWEQSQDIAQGKIDDYNFEVERERQKKLAAAEVKAEAFRASGDEEKADVVMQRAIERAPEAPAAAGLSITERLEFTILDEDAVPRKFCSPDSSLIRAFLTAEHKAGRPATIPGVTHQWIGRSSVRS